MPWNVRQAYRGKANNSVNALPPSSETLRTFRVTLHRLPRPKSLLQDSAKLAAEQAPWHELEVGFAPSSDHWFAQDREISEV